MSDCRCEVCRSGPECQIAESKKCRPRRDKGKVQCETSEGTGSRSLSLKSGTGGTVGKKGSEVRKQNKLGRKVCWYARKAPGAPTCVLQESQSDG
jgi:hypothetical protein